MCVFLHDESWAKLYSQFKFIYCCYFFSRFTITKRAYERMYFCIHTVTLKFAQNEFYSIHWYSSVSNRGNHTTAETLHKFQILRMYRVITVIAYYDVSISLVKNTKQVVRFYMRKLRKKWYHVQYIKRYGHITGFVRPKKLSK